MNEIYPSMAGQPAPDDQLDPKTVSHLLGMATSPPAHPADALAIKLADPEGRKWGLQVLGSPPIDGLTSEDLLDKPTDLEMLRQLHRHGKRTFHDSVPGDEQHEGMLWYLVAIALAIGDHDEMLSSQPKKEVVEAILVVADTLPSPWCDRLETADQ
ncbi:MAG: hypothetical protein CMJ40_02245 [Phycisphaerae bacterium]|nr:hypothetical protein [Phycisphaerae bacterium]|tara:strand:+ start:1506 stop:1973 length:468 start_codon:yes stop_codon:yes gene_type:complete